MKKVLFGFLTLLLIACSGSKDIINTGSSISFEVTPSDAYIMMNKEKIGKVSDYNPTKGGLTLSPGTHTITLIKDGYFPQIFTIQLGDSPELISADLKSAVK